MSDTRPRQQVWTIYSCPVCGAQRRDERDWCCRVARVRLHRRKIQQAVPLRAVRVVPLSSAKRLAEALGACLDEDESGSAAGSYDVRLTDGKLDECLAVLAEFREGLTPKEG